MGDFEFALVFYHRGCRLRPDLEKFRLGIEKSQEAIVNCIGSKMCRLTAPAVTAQWPLVGETGKHKKSSACTSFCPFLAECLFMHGV